MTQPPDTSSSSGPTAPPGESTSTEDKTLPPGQAELPEGERTRIAEPLPADRTVITERAVETEDRTRIAPLPGSEAPGDADRTRIAPLPEAGGAPTERTRIAEPAASQIGDGDKTQLAPLPVTGDGQSAEDHTPEPVESRGEDNDRTRLAPLPATGEDQKLENTSTEPVTSDIEDGDRTRLAPLPDDVSTGDHTAEPVVPEVEDNDRTQLAPLPGTAAEVDTSSNSPEPGTSDAIDDDRTQLAPLPSDTASEGEGDREPADEITDPSRMEDANTERTKLAPLPVGSESPVEDFDRTRIASLSEPDEERTEITSKAEDDLSGRTQILQSETTPNSADIPEDAAEVAAPTGDDAADETRISNPEDPHAIADGTDAEEGPEGQTRIEAPEPETADGTKIESSGGSIPAALPPAARSAPKGRKLAVEPGTIINNNYEIQSRINAGGMGEVYRGRNVHTDDQVAIKIVLDDLAHKDQIRALFLREANTLCKLTHPEIVRYFNFLHDQDLDRYCLVMEFIEGVPLSDWVERNGPLKFGDAKRLLRRLAGGLEKAHRMEVIHRDLSPDNVMLRDGKVEEAVLIDFGIAKSAEKTDASLHGQLAGKFKFISPEQLGHYDGIVGPWTDVYGLALLIAAAVRGTPIPMGETVYEAVEARRQIPPLDGIPVELQRVLGHMLEPDPAHRPPGMPGVIDLLDRMDAAGLRGLTMPGRTLAPGSMPPQQNPTSAAMSLPPQLSHPPGYRGGYGDQSQTPFGGGSTSPFGQTLPPQETEPDPPSRGWLWGSLGAIVVAGALSVGAWQAGMLDSMLESEVAVTDPEVETPEDIADARTPDISTREGFLAANAGPVCHYATRIASGRNSGQLEAFGQSDSDFSDLPTMFQRAFDAQPSLIQRAVGEPQCATLDFVRGLQGRGEQPPVITMDSDRIAANGTVVGRLREVRGRSIWLFMTDAEGEVHNVTSTLVPQADSSFTFSFSLNAESAAARGGQLLTAVVSDEPLLTVAAARDVVEATNFLPVVTDEIEARGGTSAAALAFFNHGGW
ncbi:MAG: serine/threonine-protein kinase [Pseudomonadota bacterium]